MIRLGLTGFPLQHSFSPAYFRKKLESEGLRNKVEYRKYETDEEEDFFNLLRRPGLHGLNVTIPWKKQAFKLAGKRDEWAERSGSANVLSRIKGGGWAAWNTDAPGFLLTLEDSIGSLSAALILGSGGAASGVKAALESKGVNCTVVSSSGRGDISYLEIDIRKLRQTDIIVNCTPLGTFPNVNSCVDLPFSLLSGREILYDLVYNPEETLFLRRGKEAGCKTINGLQMLINQAELSWDIWCFEHGIY